MTGAAGFAGGHLVELLARDGVDVVAWYRPGGRPLRSLGGRWEPLDMTDGAAVRHAVARLRPSRIYHCAGAAHVGQAWERTEATLAVNVRDTHHLVEGLRDAAVAADVVIPSSAMVYEPLGRPLREDDRLAPASPYGLSKLAQELVGRQNGRTVRVSIARAFNHLGPRQSPSFAGAGFAQRIAEIEAGRQPAEIKVGNLDAKRDLTDVRDTVRAYRLIGERGEPGRAYNVCTGHAVAIGDLLEMLRSRARVPVRVVVDPARYRPNDLPLVVGDPGRLRTELGWRPEIPLERTLDDLLDFWRNP